jgi:hypothetical protein
MLLILPVTQSVVSGELTRLNLCVHVLIPYRPIWYTRFHTHPLIGSRGDRMIGLIRVCRTGQWEDQSESDISLNPVVTSYEDSRILEIGIESMYPLFPQETD